MRGVHAARCFMEPKEASRGVNLCGEALRFRELLGPLGELGNRLPDLEQHLRDGRAPSVCRIQWLP
jgi:hypothetical protein